MDTALNKEAVKDYYGKILSSNKDLKTDACCTVESVSCEQKSILGKIAPEILDKYYGCGLPIPPALEGCHVVDLGSGSGRDAYLLSALVGQDGFVTGIDMTDEQLDVARKYETEQMNAFGFETSNVAFKKGYIEDLKSAGIDDNCADLVVSNCVINLSPDKKSVFSEIFRVLKPGGEMYISDVFSDRRIPRELREDPVLHGECISGALYIEDFRRILNELGIWDYRVVDYRPLAINNDALKEKIGAIRLYSITIRVFKLDLEDWPENYGQSVTYKGGIKGQSSVFKFDESYSFKTGKPLAVSGNTFAMLQGSRYASYFDFSGDTSCHYGTFETTYEEVATPPASSGCC